MPVGRARLPRRRDAYFDLAGLLSPDHDGGQSAAAAAAAAAARRCLKRAVMILPLFDDDAGQPAQPRASFS